MLRLYGARSGGKRGGGCCGWSFHDPPSPDDRLAPSHTPHAARQIPDPLASTAHTSCPRSALCGADRCVRVVLSGNRGGPSPSTHPPTTSLPPPRLLPPPPLPGPRPPLSTPLPLSPPSFPDRLLPFVRQWRSADGGFGGEGTRAERGLRASLADLPWRRCRVVCGSPLVKSDCGVSRQKCPGFVAFYVSFFSLFY